MTNSKTKTSLSERDISDLNKDASSLKTYMCNITDHISTPKTERGCNMSKDLEELINDLTPAKATKDVIEGISATLVEMGDIAIGVEVGSEDILHDIKRTKKHYHSAKKLIIEPVKIYQ